MKLPYSKPIKAVLLQMLKFDNRPDFMTLDKMIKSGGFNLKNYQLIDESLLLGIPPDIVFKK